MSEVIDVIVVGSGPAGAQAAKAVAAAGLSVQILHVGLDDDRYRDVIPDKPFGEIRATDASQAHYFLGADEEGIPAGAVRIGSQLTPPRQFAAHDAEVHLPIQAQGFEPMQSLALGGLGAAWGGAAYSYTAEELARAGLNEEELRDCYAQVVADIGVSGDPSDDTGPWSCGGAAGLQPPLDLDEGHATLLRAYQRLRERGQVHPGLRIGRVPLAMLSRPLGDRRENPYFDMDFWSDSRRSMYRPRYTIEALVQSGAVQVVNGVLVTSFAEESDGTVRVDCAQLDMPGRSAAFRARRVILCAGAINSARIVLTSRADGDTRVPILCNPYTYLPCIQGRMLGRPAADRRHSMAQLQGAFAASDDPTEALSLQFYSYRSLLAFKLVKEMPLPVWAGTLAVRVLQTSLVIVGLHHPDWPLPENWLRLAELGRSRPSALEAHYAPPRAAQERRNKAEMQVIRALAGLGCVPVQRLRPGHASSIHYAGTLPFQPPGSDDRLGCAPDGRVLGTRHVWAGDSAPWRFLPAKGPTLTIMACARRAAAAVVESLAGR